MQNTGFSLDVSDSAPDEICVAVGFFGGGQGQHIAGEGCKANHLLADAGRVGGDGDVMGDGGAV